jgi:Uma2 family endonuclease
MAGPAPRIDPVTLDEFEAMSFGDRKAELIDGVIVIPPAFPTWRHGQIVASVGANLENALRAAGQPCRVSVGTGIGIRLDRDWCLGPDVMVQRGETRRETRDPVMVVEVVSPSDSATEMMKKLHAYQAVDSIADILLVEQDAYAVDHWTRTPDGAWTLRPHLSGPDAVLTLPSMGGEWRLEELYGDG